MTKHACMTSRIFRWAKTVKKPLTNLSFTAFVFVLFIHYLTLNLTVSISRMTLMMSWQVVLPFTPEIHLVTSSTVTGTSPLSSLWALTRPCFDNVCVDWESDCLAFVKWLSLLFSGGYACSLDLGNDLLLELSFGAVGNVLERFRPWWELSFRSLSNNMIHEYSTHSLCAFHCHWSHSGTSEIKKVFWSACVIGCWPVHLRAATARRECHTPQVTRPSECDTDAQTDTHRTQSGMEAIKYVNGRKNMDWVIRETKKLIR